MHVSFLSRKQPAEVVTAPDPTTPETPVGKGRPTPSRKEAEAQRKQTLKVPSDPKEAKKAAKARAAEERAAARAALLAGDESGLPARDAGEVKRFVRDYVDGRWAAAELFLPLALVVLVMGFLPLPDAQRIVSSLWLVLILVMIVDTTMLMWRLDRELSRRWPDKADRKGAVALRPHAGAAAASAAPAPAAGAPRRSTREAEGSEGPQGPQGLICPRSAAGEVACVSHGA